MRCTLCEGWNYPCHTCHSIYDGPLPYDEGDGEETSTPDPTEKAQAGGNDAPEEGM
jgi:hypothetical protein